MTAPADLVLTNAEVHTLAAGAHGVETGGGGDGDGDGAADLPEAIAVRDGRIVRVDSAYEIEFLTGVDTTVVDCDGGVVLPGFIDAHTHLPMVGRSLVHADLSGASGPDDAVARLADRDAELDREGTDADADADAGEDDGATDWVLGYGYDESGWDEPRYLTRADLDAVSESRPVVAFREDMHVASVNSVVVDRYAHEMPADDVHRDADGSPTGVLVEEAVDVVYRETEPGFDETRDLVRAARDFAHAHGVTGIHDMVRTSHAPRVYRELDRAAELGLRVRLNYWTTHLDSLVDLGAVTGHGSDLVQVGAVKSYTDGSFGGRTAKLSEPYEGGDTDADGGAGPEGGVGPDGDAGSDGSAGDAGTGQWVVEPDELRGYVERADDAGLQFCAHAIGDEAVGAVLDAYAACDDPAGSRHRVEHAELLSDDAIERFADIGVVASVQPNFLKWAREGGLYEQRLGPDRTARTNRFRDLLNAGVPLAFGSDCMPLGPLFGVQQAVTAPHEGQRLSVTEALRAYTTGAAHAGFDDHRLGTIEPGKRADLVVLDDSPWDVDPDAIADIDVDCTVVDGSVVFQRDG